MNYSKKIYFLYIIDEAINILNYMILKIYRIYRVDILKYCTIHKVLPLFIYYMQLYTLYGILHNIYICDHKTSLKSLGIFVAIAKNIAWVKIRIFILSPKSLGY